MFSRFMFLILFVWFAGCDMIKTSSQQNVELARVSRELQKYKDKESADERLGQYTINMMYKSRKTVATLSPAAMQVLAREIVKVSNDIFETEADKQAFIAVLQIESGFLRFAQSPTGPKGLTQLAKLTFKSAMANCGVKDVKEEDVWDTSLNLYGGACYFKEQLIRENGLIPAAMADYNQGPDAADSKSYSKNGSLTKLEPAAYIAKYAFLQATVTDRKEPNVPALKDLPVPGKNVKFDSTMDRAKLESVKRIGSVKTK